MYPAVKELQDSPLLLTVKGAAHALGVSPTSIWRLTKAGDLETRKIGGRTLVTMESIRRVAEHGAGIAAA